MVKTVGPRALTAVVGEELRAGVPNAATGAVTQVADMGPQELLQLQRMIQERQKLLGTTRRVAPTPEELRHASFAVRV